MDDFARTLVRVGRGKKAVLSGYPDGDTSTWHVQTSVRIGEEGDNRRVTILQRTEHPDEWMTVVLTEVDDRVTVESIGVAEGEPPTDGDDERAADVDPADVEVVEVGTASFSERA